MPFPFTFSISVPGMINPFNRSPNPSDDAGDSPSPDPANNIQEKQWHAVRRPHPSALPPPVPLARKRGWKPSSPEPSPAAAITTSTCGHHNIPLRYRDFTVTPEAMEEEEEPEEIAAGECYLHLADSAYISLSNQNASRRLCYHVTSLRTCHVWSMLFSHGRHVYAMHTLHLHPFI